MSTLLANQPAFPHIADVLQNHPDGSTTVRPVTSGGMTLRQHYAGLAMQGMVAAYNSSERIVGLSHDAETHGETKVEQTLARWAVDQADALLSALEGKK